MPAIVPSISPNNALREPWTIKIVITEVVVNPWVFNTATSVVLSTTIITNADTILNAATATIKLSINDIIFFSIFTAENK